MRMTGFHHGSASARRSSAVRFLGFASAMLLLLSSPPARADVTWNVASGDWSVATDWSGGLPISGINADIFNGGTVTVTTAGELLAAAFTLATPREAARLT